MPLSCQPRDVATNASERTSRSFTVHSLLLGPSLLRGVSAVVAIQFFCRFLSFMLQILIIRIVDASTYGIATVSFPLLCNISLYFTKEAIRKAALRNPPSPAPQATFPSSVDSEKEGKTKSIETLPSAPPSTTTGTTLPTDAEALFRQTAGQSAINLGWFSFGWVILFSFLLGGFWTLFPPNLPDLGNVYTLSTKIAYRRAIWILCLATVVEAVSEPLLIYCLRLQHFTWKAIAEGGALVVKTSVTLCCLGPVLWLPVPFNTAKYSLLIDALKTIHMHPLLAFAYGQFSFAVFWFCFLAYKCANNLSTAIYPDAEQSATPSSAHTLNKPYKLTWLTTFRKTGPLLRKLESETSVEHSQNGVKRTHWTPYLTQFHAEIGGHYLILAFEKFLLAEGEKFLLMGLFSTDQWGCYSVITNLATSVVRFVFAPVEEYAAATFSANPDTEVSYISTDTYPHPERPSEASSHSLNQQLGSIYTPTVHIVLLRGFLLGQTAIGYFGGCFGSLFTASVLYILYGERWLIPDAPLLLQSYCFLLFFLSMNGILETYLYATASTQWLRCCQITHFFIWVTSMLVCSFLWANNIGIRTLVYSNCFMVGCRCVFVLFYLYTEQQRLNRFQSKRDKSHAVKRVLSESYALITHLFPVPIIRIAVVAMIVRCLCSLCMTLYLPYGGMLMYVLHYSPWDPATLLSLCMHDIGIGFVTGLTFILLAAYDTYNAYSVLFDTFRAKQL